VGGVLRRALIKKKGNEEAQTKGSVTQIRDNSVPSQWVTDETNKPGGESWGPEDIENICIASL